LPEYEGKEKGNPFAESISPPQVDKLIDRAFKRAFQPKSVPKGLDPLTEARVREKMRIMAFRDVMWDTLRSCVRSFPPLEAIHPFYRDLAEVLVGIDRLKHCLGALEWAAKVVRRVAAIEIRNLSRSSDFTQLEIVRKRAMARMTSVVKRVSEEIECVREAAAKLRKLPSVDPYTPSIVIAGAPNTGKSTLVRQISTGRPEVAEYPFTTKGILVGHTLFRGVGKVQVIDTPGLLDRPISRRNVIERQAIVALRRLASVILYVADPTTTCGYGIDHQVNLLREILAEFPEIPTVMVLNKADLRDLFKNGERPLRKVCTDQGVRCISISAKRGDGLEELLRLLWEELRFAPQN